MSYYDGIYCELARQEILENLKRIQNTNIDELLENDLEYGSYLGIDENGNELYLTDKVYALLLDLHGNLISIAKNYDQMYNYVWYGCGEAIALQGHWDMSTAEVQNMLIEIMEEHYPQRLTKTL